MFTIKNFQNKYECSNVSDLIETLKSKCAGKSVGISFKLASGIIKSRYVDVSYCGRITDSYQENLPVNFKEIEALAVNAHVKSDALS